MIGNARLAACVAEAYGPVKLRGPKITPLQASVIVGAYRRGAGQVALAKAYGVAQSTISRTITEQLKQSPEAPAHAGASLMKGAK